MWFLIILAVCAVALYVVPRLIDGRPIFVRSLKSSDPKWRGPKQADNTVKYPPLSDH